MLCTSYSSSYSQHVVALSIRLVVIVAVSKQVKQSLSSASASIKTAFLLQHFTAKNVPVSKLIE